MMRVFFALEPDEASRLAIAQWQQLNGPHEARPVPAANFHLTLAFIGEVGNSRLEKICKRADRALEDKPVSAFGLTLDSVGYWPKQNLWWIGPTEQPGELLQLASQLRNIARRYNNSDGKKPFRPHMNLARRCVSPPPETLQQPCFPLQFDRFSLLESKQGRNGVSYHPIAEWPLGDGQN
mgnify:CR=1 FL=1